jgi:hypothetical protein
LDKQETKFPFVPVDRYKDGQPITKDRSSSALRSVIGHQDRHPFGHRHHGRDDSIAETISRLTIGCAAEKDAGARLGEISSFWEIVFQTDIPIYARAHFSYLFLQIIGTVLLNVISSKN